MDMSEGTARLTSKLAEAERAAMIQRAVRGALVTWVAYLTLVCAALSVARPARASVRVVPATPTTAAHGKAHSAGKRRTYSWELRCIGSEARVDMVGTFRSMKAAATFRAAHPTCGAPIPLVRPADFVDDEFLVGGDR